MAPDAEGCGVKKGGVVLNILDFLNQNYPVRRTEKEKDSFRAEIIRRLAEKGVDARVESTGDGKNKNIVIGDVASAKVVCTAHYDTPAAALFPNIMIPRNSLLFYLYQFTPIVLLLGIALAGGYLAAASMPDPTYFSQVFLLVYLVIYYGLYILLYRTFKNPNNCNDNTSGVAAVLALIDKLSGEQRKKAAFILFDNEEKGKKGSKAYNKDHKEMMRERLVVNFDCVGNGEHVVFVAMEGAEKHQSYAALRESFSSGGGFHTYFYPIKGSQSNSDYKNFPCGVGCMACRRSKGGVLYTPYIHTPRDKVSNYENIAFITDAMSRFVEIL